MSDPERAPPRAVVFGCAGPELSAVEARFFAAANPLGFILFARNCREPGQVRRLVDALRAAVGRGDAPVLIDQEGGRVARLGPPHWPERPAMRVFGDLARRRPEAAREAARLDARLIAADLAALGIDVDCAPVLDVPAEGAHEVIGDRAFGSSPALVAELGRAVCEGLMAGGVSPVIKHVPGHGRARADSHRACPVVDAPLAALRGTDFAPFRCLCGMPWAMTAHVIYTALDPRRPASVSPPVIERVVRGEIAFDGVLVSDDIGMGALTGAPEERAAAVLAAGCDVALHCSGDLAEMARIADAAPPLTDRARARLGRARAQALAPDAAECGALERRLAALLAA